MSIGVSILSSHCPCWLGQLSYHAFFGDYLGIDQHLEKVKGTPYTNNTPAWIKNPFRQWKRMKERTEKRLYQEINVTPLFLFPGVSSSNREKKFIVTQERKRDGVNRATGSTHREPRVRGGFANRKLLTVADTKEVSVPSQRLRHNRATFPHTWRRALHTERERARS